MLPVLIPSARSGRCLTARAPDGSMRDLVVRLSRHAPLPVAMHLLSARDPQGCMHGGGRELPLRDFVRLIAALHDRYRVRRVRFTGGEPLLRVDLPT